MLLDHEIVVLLSNKPEKGMKKLMQAYGGLAYAIVREKLSPLLSEEDVEECVGDVLFEVYEKRALIGLQDGSLKGFLALTAKRRAIDRFRQAARKEPCVSLEDDTQNRQLQAGEPLHLALEQAELRDRLVREIRALGLPDSEILTRKYYCGQTSREIASALGMKENTVDQRARRSLQKLRKQLNLSENLGGKSDGT